MWGVGGNSDEAHAPTPLRPYAPSNLSKTGRNRSTLAGTSSGNTRTLPTTDMKLVSPVQRGTTCTCRWSAMPAPAALPTIDADVQALRAVHLGHGDFGARGEVHHFGAFLGGQLRQPGNVPVGHDHQVAAVVRVEVEDDKRRRPRATTRGSPGSADAALQKMQPATGSDAVVT